MNVKEQTGTRSRLVTDIVGNRFRPIGGQVAYANLVPGDKLTVRREPDNEYDPNAISVWTDIEGAAPEHMGYIPRHRNEYLSAWMDDTDQPTLPALWDGDYLTVEYGSDEE